MEVKNITVGEFFELEDASEYEIFVNTLNAKNYYLKKSCIFEELSFDKVEVIKLILNNPTKQNIMDLFVDLFDIRTTKLKTAEQRFLSESVFVLFSAKKYIENFIRGINEKEKKHLAGEPDVKMQMINAGKRLEKVSHLLTKIDLAQMFSTTPQEIGSWKYTTVFSILVALKRQADVIKDYKEIK